MAKILISGEDLFSDKQSLLLGNFPSQAIENIQAIENQSNQPLLKGLKTDNQIFVNLQLKKKYIKAAFGTTELGMSTNGSYNLNLVLFSLYGKLKLAYIGNNNSQGYGSGANSENELRNAQIRSIEKWMPAFYNFRQIQELDARHYISNELWDNRLKLNLPLTKNLVSETEFIYIDYHRSQQYISESNLINDTVLTKRNIWETTDYMPEKLWIKQGLKWNMNNKNSLSGAFHIYRDKTRQHILNNQIQDNFFDTTKNSNKNNYQSFMATAGYIGRVNDELAIQIDLEYGHHNYRQQSNTFSNSLSQLFNIRDSFNLIDLNRNVSAAYMSAKATFFKKTGNRIISPSLLYIYEKNTVEDAYNFKNNLHKNLDSVSSQFTQPGIFKYHRLEGAHTFHFKIGKNSLRQTTQLGIFKTEEENFSHLSTRTDAIGKLALKWEKNKKHTSQEVDLSWNRIPLSLPEINSRLFPGKTTYFTLNKIKNQAVTNSLNGMYSSRTTLKNQRSFYTLFSINLQANSPVYRNSYDRFLQISIDSITNQITHSIFANLFYNFKIKSIESYVNINGGYYNLAHLILIHDRIHKTTTHNLNLNVVVSKYYKRRHFIDFSSKFQYYIVRYPSSLQEVSSNKDYAQVWLGLKYEYRANEKWSFFLDTKLLGEDIFNPQNRNLFFAISSMQFTPVKSKFRFTVSVDNITNLHSFQNIQAAGLYFNQTHIPLIGRNLQFKVYYGL